MKLEKNERTPYIMKTTKHFNDVSMGWAAFLSGLLFAGASKGCKGNGLEPG